ncbi:uncharacterized protein RCC_07433 [Ramularia collo-cygni]|uniref:Thioesterase domain-containing protein n=1 Tax=Ramularia collo-cygni TaxID=112498 RepID=A0A2D3V806_9PEZI|nr:uncharacterized protein RCC_07433 [Ramularia collo-cygni]CZT21570.1 uncharacterized protein RCC_07433 [Ramularia collo-cygni]
MAPSDTKDPFLRVPWIASQIGRPDVICRPPKSREPKDTSEDSLWAETLKDSRTINSCICFYQKPASGVGHAEEVSTAMTIGDGLNGHPAILHGGITSTMVDEAMGMYQMINKELAYEAQVQSGKVDGELPPVVLHAFTVELNIKYLRTVQTPGNVVITVKRVKVEGRKEWLAAELKQCTEHGAVEVCATGEALFITPRVSPRPSKI